MANPTVPIVCFSNIDCEVIKKRYVINDQIAIQLVASDSERNILKGTCPGKPVCTATQCIVSEKFSESATAIKDYYENKGVFNVLKAAGLIEETIHYLHEGSFYYPVVKVNF